MFRLHPILGYYKTCLYIFYFTYESTSLGEIGSGTLVIGFFSHLMVTNPLCVQSKIIGSLAISNSIDVTGC